MADETAYSARMRKEAAADECVTVMLEGVRAFFSGKATLHIEPMKPGVGQAVRFIRDPEWSPK